MWRRFAPAASGLAAVGRVSKPAAAFRADCGENLYMTENKR
jgi:hypothetical protein